MDLGFPEQLENRFSDIENRLNDIEEGMREPFLTEELKRDISVDIVRHLFHVLEYGRSETQGKCKTSKVLKSMFKIYDELDYKLKDELIEELIQWGISAIKSRGL